MASLTEADVELIRASWVRARTEPTDAGVLLFRGLFTKFPDYLRLFNQFEDLDIERMHEHKRLVKHAIKVIETVTFVVDSIGDPTKGDLLNEALVNLVRGHAKRRIGLDEFQNLGIVLIDFICDLNNRRGASRAASERLSSSSGDGVAGGPPCASTRACNSSTSSSLDSGTMTSTLDKIRASLSTSSSCSDDDNILSQTLGELADEPMPPLSGLFLDQQNHHSDSKYHEDHNANINCDPDGQRLAQSMRLVKLDTSHLVIAWKKLYKVILDLVRSEEEAPDQ